jgi:hypothetical protein
LETTEDHREEKTDKRNMERKETHREEKTEKRHRREIRDQSRGTRTAPRHNVRGS